MKLKIAFFTLICFFYSDNTIGCPTCIGKLKLKSDPFFSDKFYQAIQSEYTNIENDDDDIEVEIEEEDEE